MFRFLNTWSWDNSISGEITKYCILLKNDYQEVLSDNMIILENIIILLENRLKIKSTKKINN